MIYYKNLKFLKNVNKANSTASSIMIENSVKWKSKTIYNLLINMY